MTEKERSKDHEVGLSGFVYRARLAANLTQNHTINWDSAQYLNYSKNNVRQLNLESCYSSLGQTWNRRQ